MFELFVATPVLVLTVIFIAHTLVTNYRRKQRTYQILVGEADEGYCLALYFSGARIEFEATRWSPYFTDPSYYAPWSRNHFETKQRLEVQSERSPRTLDVWKGLYHITKHPDFQWVPAEGWTALVTQLEYFKQRAPAAWGA